MAKMFLVRESAERFIHNDLSNCSHWFHEQAKAKYAGDNRTGVALDLMAGLVFCAFSVEAKVNFVGWRVREDEWPELASTSEKINLLNEVLQTDLSWGKRPLQSIGQLFKLRNTFAHGKPEIVEDAESIVDVEPEIWEALRGDWEASVNESFLARCREDEKVLWSRLLDSAGIEVYQTLTHGGHSISVLIDETEAI